jgi:hypothetical protein
MTGRPKGTPKTGGRKKGTPNKISSALKDAILEAAEQAGGEDGIVGYLVAQALANPVAFMSLLGKVLPMTLTGGTEKDDAPVKIITEVVWPIGPDGKRVYPSWWKQSDRVDPSITSSVADDDCRHWQG